MKRLFNKLILLIFFISAISFGSVNFVYSSAQISTISKDTLEILFNQFLPKAEITKMETGKFFSRKYKVMLPQKLNHSDANSELFNQRIFVSHRGFDRPTVIVTEGYVADYAEGATYSEELCSILNANLIFVEHRYFGQSKPKNVNWKYLTIKQASDDYHNIITIFKNIYPSKWVSTGTSKGGSTSLYFKALYPNDVDAVVAYVAPLTNAQEDMRPINYLMNIAGSKEERKLVEDFQLRLFKNIDKYIKLLEEFAKNNKMTFPLSTNTTMEYLILEYPFSYFQWGWSANKIPNKTADIYTNFNHLIKVVPPSSFDNNAYENFGPFYYQAYTEVGYYNYNAYIPKFKKYLKQNNYSNFVFAPDNKNIVYNSKSIENIRELLNKNATHIIQIQGSLDPWYQTAWIPKDSVNLPVFVNTGNSHGVRISDFNITEREKIYGYLEKWLDLKIERKK